MSSKADEPTRPVRIIERSHRTLTGITRGRAHNVTWHWVQEFFQDPGQHLENLLGVSSFCLATESCLALADELLREQRSNWNKSGERGRILVCLAYVLGESVLRDRPELDWVVVAEAGTEFVDDIGLGSGDEMIGVFSKLANVENFILREDKFDLRIWKHFLSSAHLLKIHGKRLTVTLVRRD